MTPTLWLHTGVKVKRYSVRLYKRQRKERDVDDHPVPHVPGTDRLYAALSEKGGALMPLGDYGFSTKFGWVNDRYGVSWQLTLP